MAASQDEGSSMDEHQAEQIRRFLEARQVQAQRLRDGHIDAAVLASVTTGNEGWRLVQSETQRN